MERASYILRKTRDFLMGKKNVVGVGVGMKQVGMERTDSPAIIVFVEKKVSPDNLYRGSLVPSRVDDVATDVVEIGKVRLLDDRTHLVRPAYPGVSIGHYSVTAGTFGAVVKDRRTGHPLILSNNHILANATDGKDGRARLGDPVFQPGSYDGGKEKDVIAHLERFIPLVRNVKEAECPVAVGVARDLSRVLQLIKPGYEMRFFRHYRGSNIVDAAVAKPVSPDMIKDNILEIGRPQGIDTAGLNRQVMKSGRTSGLTSGTVTAVDVTMEVELTDKEYGTFTNQVVSNMLSKGGDSGSLVLDERKRAVGLLFAGSEKYTIFSRIENVFNLLGIELN